MGVLARWSSLLLVGGGALMTVVLIAMTIAPTSPAIYGFFVVAPAIGVGVLGALLMAGSGTGWLARSSAWIGGLAGIAVLIVGAFAVATGQFSASGVGGDDPMAIPFALTSTAWMLGSLGFALALVRGGSIAPVGGWLVLAGTVTALGLGTLLGAVAPQLSPLAALPFGIGWSVVGWTARRGV